MGCMMMGKQKDKRIRSIYCHEQTKVKPPIENTRYKKLSLGNVKKTQQKSWNIMQAFKKPLLKDLSNGDLVTLCELIATKIGKPKIRLYAIIGRWA